MISTSDSTKLGVIATVTITLMSVSATGWRSAGGQVNDIGLCFLSGSSEPSSQVKVPQLQLFKLICM